jgi:hypothetical protein
MLTFFCKRDRHVDCPGEWPVGESCGPDHDCSFDMRMMKCACECHVEKKNVAAQPSTTTAAAKRATAASKRAGAAGK